MKDTNENKANSKTIVIREYAEKAKKKMQKILDTLIEFEEHIRSTLLDYNIIDEELLKQFDYKNIKLRWVGNELKFLHLTVNGKIIPKKVEQLGRAFNGEYMFADMDDIGYLIDNLEPFLRNMKKKSMEYERKHEMG